MIFIQTKKLSVDKNYYKKSELFKNLKEYEQAICS